MSELDLKHNRDNSRYEAWDGDTLAGFVEYELADALVVFPHTEVKSAYEGHGVGSRLARFALDDVRAQGPRKVVPACPFIKGWIQRHTEYADLVHGASTSTTTS